MTGHILLGCAVVALYAALRLAFPAARCPRCLGRRVIGRSKRRPGRVRKCWACQGHGRVIWPGAAAVHRFFWSVLGRRLMDRRKETIRARISGEDR